MAGAVPRLGVYDVQGHRVVPIDAPVFTIGRRAGQHLQVSGTEVSREHAEIAATPEGYVVRDRGSRYGTFVNGERVTEQRLAHGDRIECGRQGAVIIFLEAGAPDALPGPAAAGDLRQVATLLDSLRDMGTERVLDEVLALVLDSAIQATGAERGFIMLADSGGMLDLKLARGAGQVTLPSVGFEMSHRIPREVFASGQTLVVTDLLEGDLPEVHTGTVALGIRHVLCAPLRLVRYVERPGAAAAPRNIGVLYLDSRERGRLLSPAARAALDALAGEAAMAIENAHLYQQAVEKARLDDELRRAWHIQQALLPEPRRIGRFYEAVGASVPSRTIGGDFFDYCDLPDGRFRFALGDVTGKGPSAALLTAVVQGILGAEATSTAGPAELVALVNRVLLSRRIESRFATIFLGVLSADGRLVYCNAAQNPPLLVTAKGLRRLDAGGTLTGAFPQAAYAQEEVRLVAGDTVVLFSDGITEAANPSDEEFGEARVRDVIARRTSGAPDVLLQDLFEAVRAFTAGLPQQDDLTAMVVRYGG